MTKHIILIIFMTLTLHFTCEISNSKKLTLCNCKAIPTKQLDNFEYDKGNDKDPIYRCSTKRFHTISGCEDGKVFAGYQMNQIYRDCHRNTMDSKEKTNYIDAVFGINNTLCCDLCLN